MKITIYGTHQKLIRKMSLVCVMLALWKHKAKNLINIII